MQLVVTFADGKRNKHSISTSGNCNRNCEPKHLRGVENHVLVDQAKISEVIRALLGNVSDAALGQGGCKHSSGFEGSGKRRTLLRQSA